MGAVAAGSTSSTAAENTDGEAEGSLAGEPETAAADGEAWPSVPEIEGEAVVVMEAITQVMLYEKNADEKMYPASTTKILTAMIVLERCSLDEIVTFSENACNQEDGAVTIDSQPGEEMTVKDCMYALLLPSANDAAYALAEHVAGSVEAFAELMNEKAKEIGTTSSNFVNPSGLFHRDHYTTANDLAKIAQYAFQNSTFVDIISHPTYTIGPTNKTKESRELTNTHEMIVPGSSDYNEYVIGGKTGYLYESGRVLVTYAKKNGITLLTVIMDGAYSGIFSETQELLDFGWSNFTIKNVSESESRFSYAGKNARVQIDPTSQILSLNGVEFKDLDSKITFAYDLDENEYAEAKKAAGIEEGDSRRLYATIDYSYAGHDLGSCNVFINTEMEITDSPVVNIYYISPWFVVLGVAVIIAVVVIILRIRKKKKSELRYRYRYRKRR